jgi:hypothetical protein
LELFESKLRRKRCEIDPLTILKNRAKVLVSKRIGSGFLKRTPPSVRGGSAVELTA